MNTQSQLSTYTKLKNSVRKLELRKETDPRRKRMRNNNVADKMMEMARVSCRVSLYQHSHPHECRKVVEIFTNNKSITTESLDDIMQDKILLSRKLYVDLGLQPLPSVIDNNTKPLYPVSSSTDYDTDENESLWRQSRVLRSKKQAHFPVRVLTTTKCCTNCGLVEGSNYILCLICLSCKIQSMTLREEYVDLRAELSSNFGSLQDQRNRILIGNNFDYLNDYV